MNEPLSAAQVASTIARALVTDLDTGETVELTSRLNSRCLFFEPFPAGAYVVQLRLDWGDLDNCGRPRLDADFLDPDSRRPDHSMRGHSAHHADAAASGPRVYEWSFDDAARRFTVSVSWFVSGRTAATSPASGSVTVVRAPRDEA
jgi:hypothetical protein